MQTLGEDAGVGEESVDDAGTLAQREGFAVLDGQQTADVDGEILLVGKWAQQRQKNPLRLCHLDGIRRKSRHAPRSIYHKQIATVVL